MIKIFHSPIIGNVQCIDDLDDLDDIWEPYQGSWVSDFTIGRKKQLLEVKKTKSAHAVVIAIKCH